jgi:hypothetical protein
MAKYNHQISLPKMGSKILYMIAAETILNARFNIEIFLNEIFNIPASFRHLVDA